MNAAMNCNVQQPSENTPNLLSILDVLKADCYSVPIYQRNYAWGETEIEQLLDDVSDYASKPNAKDYYIGTLVVYAETSQATGHHQWQVVDGQQRLTTLTLLGAVLRKYTSDDAVHHLLAPIQSMNLRFDSRQDASDALQAIFRNYQVQAPARKPGQSDGGASTIWAGRDVLLSKLERMLKDKNLSIAQFASYLLHRVRLLRVELPPHTDLNHYFEVMNSRGEQLAKHEVLKARLLSHLHDSGDTQAMRALHTVWDACSVIGRYAQLGFEPALRTKIFEVQGYRLNVANADALCAHFATTEETQGVQSLSLAQLVIQAAVESEQTIPATAEEGFDEGDAKFGAVINWPNFLLQVLALMRHVQWKESLPGPGTSTKEFAPPPHVVLDDKQLLEQFDSLHSQEDIRHFTYLLLQCRFLLDQYVIKRTLHDGPVEEEHWVLKRCRFRSDKSSMYAVNTFGQEAAEAGQDPWQAQLAMLQAAFHASYPLARRKHWLQATLRWLYANGREQVDPARFLKALEGLAQSFALEVGTGLLGEVHYEDVVNRLDDFAPEGLANLSQGQVAQKLKYPNVHPFVFNYLDYLLWRDSTEKAGNFAFSTARRSVEHLHPQNQNISGSTYQWHESHLHAFGNLCLVTQSMNSKLSDRAEDAKFGELLGSAFPQSLKIKEMQKEYKNNSSKWNPITVILHEQRVLELLGFKKQEVSKMSASESIGEIIQILKANGDEQFSVAWAQRKLRAGYENTCAIRDKMLEQGLMEKMERLSTSGSIEYCYVLVGENPRENFEWFAS